MCSLLQELVTVTAPQSIVSRHIEYISSYTYEELEEHISTLLQAQQKLARSSRTESTYCIVLHQRLTLLKRILYAFAVVKYDFKEKVSNLNINIIGTTGFLKDGALSVLQFSLKFGFFFIVIII